MIFLKNTILGGVTLLILTGFGPFTAMNAQAQQPLRIGVARMNITPADPMTMDGYGGREDSFTGVHDSLFATAIVLDDGVKKAVIISAEVIGFSHEEWERLTDRIERATGIEKKYVLLTAVHNHGAAKGTALPDQLCDVVGGAMQVMQPAWIGMGVGTCMMNMNRRALNPETGHLHIGLNPYGPCDRDVAVMRMDDAHGDPFAVFVNWPCHAVVLGAENTLLTGDWPGAARRYLEREFNDGIIASITAGASGNINPIYPVLPNFKRHEAEEIGILLGREVKRVSGEIQATSDGKICASQRVITLPGKKRAKTVLPDEIYEPDADVDVHISLLKVGTILFVGISGELFTEIGMKIKEMSPYKNTIVLTHCNGSSGYLVTDAAYPEGGYEVQVTRIMSGAEQAILKNVMTMIQEL